MSLPLRDAHATGPASLAIRPQSIDIRPLSGADAPALRGRIAEREFLGTLVRYRVAVGPHRILVDTLHQRDVQSFATGDEVALAVDPDQVTILPD